MSSPLGLYTFLVALIPEGHAVKIALALPFSVLLISLWIAWAVKEERNDTPASLPKSWLFTARPFFRSQFDFLARGYKITGQSIYQFQLFQHKVVVLSGEPARRDFFAAGGLSLVEGFKILSGAIPMVPGVTSEIGTRRIHLIHKRLGTVQNSDRLSRLIPQVLDDTARIMQSWGTAGTLNPFEDIHHLLFQTALRCLSSADLADDPVRVLRLKALYDKLDSHTTPASVLLPWFPSLSAIKRLWATKEIYDIVSGAVDHRLQSGIPQNDTLQLLVDSADDKMVIVGFIMGLLAAGARSTGTTASWLITFLGGHPCWRQRAAAEVRELLFPLESDACPEAPPAHDAPSASLASLRTRLSTVPLETWEGATPVLDALIRETLRLAQPHAAMRRNMGPALALGGKTVLAGAFVVYPFSDVHLSAELYPDPWRFDPARTQSKMPLSYVGWGAGKTVCLGQRLAKLELKLVAAMFLLGFEFSAVDRTGRALEVLPRPNWNDVLTCKPPKESCFLKYERAGR